VQVDPIKPKLKPPGTERLKLSFDLQLSTSAFEFNLRCCTKVVFCCTWSPDGTQIASSSVEPW